MVTVTVLTAAPVSAQCPPVLRPAGTSAAGQGANGPIFQMFELGNGNVLVGGSFTRIGGINASNIALYQPGSNTWSALGSGVSGPVYAIATVSNTGSGGTDYIVGGAFGSAGGNSASNIARFRTDTQEWSSLGSGVSGGTVPVSAIATLPNGNLVVGGTFTSAGGSGASRIVRLSPNNSPPQWTALGAGVSNSGATECTVSSITVLTGGDFIIGGDFSTAGGQPASNIARYLTVSGAWSPLGVGTNGPVMLVRNLFPTTDVLIGGAFTSAGGESASRVVRYNATSGSWTPLGSGLSNTVYSGTRLPGGDYIFGGDFTASGSIAAGFIARFNPLTGVWSDLPPMVLNGRVRAIVAQSLNNSDGRLILGGSFTSLGDASNTSERFGRFDLGAIPPVIATQPQSVAVCPGGTATFSVTISTSLSTTFQWRRGTTVVGTNSPTLTLTNVSAASVGEYTCVLSTACGTTTTVPAALTLNTAVTITGQPTLPLVCAGSPLSLSVTASGSGPLTFRWRKGGVNISTATNPSAATSTLVLPAPGAGDAGSYDCVVTGACGAVASNAVNVPTPPTPVAIISQPASVVPCRGWQVTFTVGATGTGPLSYQWRKNGAPISAVTNASAATPSLVLPSVDVVDDGSYDCVVSDPCRSVTSDAVNMAVNTSVPTITSEPVDTVRCAGEPIQLSVSATGSGNVFYMWRRNGEPIAPAVNPSATTPTLQLTGTPNDITGRYDCIVRNNCNAVTSRTVNVAVRGPRWVALTSLGFTSNGVQGIVTSMTKLPSGDLLIGGDFGAATGGAPSNMGLISGGQIAPDGQVTSVVMALAVRSGDGVPFAAGAVGTQGFVARRVGGWTTIATTSGPVNALAAAPNGDIIAAGPFTYSIPFGGGTATRVMRYRANEWQAMELPLIPEIRAVAALPNGTIILGGIGNAADYSDRIATRTADATGWTASVPSGSFGGYRGDVWTMLVNPGVSTIYGGRYSYRRFGSNTNVLSGVYNTAGASNLNSACDGTVFAVAYLPDGRLVVGGSFGAIGGVAASNIAVYSNGGWQPLAGGVNGPVRALAVGADGDLYVGGQFSLAGGVPGGLPVGNIARFSFDVLGLTAPATVAACPGETVGLQYSVNEPNPSPIPLQFQWRKDGVNIDPATNSSANAPVLAVQSVAAGDLGVYDCIVSNGCTSVTGPTVTLSFSAACVPAACSLADLAGAGDNGLAPDGTLDGTDFIAFINSFGIGDATVDPLADVAGAGPDGLQADGTIDGSDFIAFINAFGQGC